MLTPLISQHPKHMTKEIYDNIIAFISTLDLVDEDKTKLKQVITAKFKDEEIIPESVEDSELSINDNSSDQQDQLYQLLESTPEIELPDPESIDDNKEQSIDIEQSILEDMKENKIINIARISKNLTAQLLVADAVLTTAKYCQDNNITLSEEAKKFFGVSSFDKDSPDLNNIQINADNMRTMLKRINSKIK